MRLKNIVVAFTGLLFTANVFAASFIFNMENDAFMGSDEDYTNGIELGYRPTGSRYTYGVKQLMYTPAYISLADPQPGDRPWSGILTFFVDDSYIRGPLGHRKRLEVGVLGPSAKAAQAQRYIHKWLDRRKPLGWHNQLKDEPVVQYTHDIAYRIFEVGSRWGLGVDINAGYEVGTVFAGAKAGPVLLAGYNLPRARPPAGIVAKAVPDWRIYAFTGATGAFRPHNATIGRSIFRDRKGKRESVEPWVGEVTAGAALEYRDFFIEYAANQRSNEYKGQKKSADWGLISVGYNRQF